MKKLELTGKKFGNSKSSAKQLRPKALRSLTGDVECDCGSTVNVRGVCLSTAIRRPADALGRSKDSTLGLC
jgi:hypothetical protein